MGTLAIIGLIVLAIIGGLLKMLSAGRRIGAGESAQEMVKQNAKTLENVRRSAEAARESDRINADPSRLREDDGHKRKS